MVNYKYEEGKIEKTSTNRLINIKHEESLYDFYIVHPEYSDIWELGDALEESTDKDCQKAGRAIKRLFVMLIRENNTRYEAHLLDYAKRMLRRVLINSNDPVKKEMALSFVYSKIRKGFSMWKARDFS